MGRHGEGEANANGELLSDFCVFNGLVIGGTVFPHKRIHKVTWVSPDHRTENQIDHICISSNFRRSMQDVRSRRGADVGSDHHLVIGKFKLKLKKYLTQGTTQMRRYNVEQLMDQNTRANFKLELANRFALLSQLPEDASVEQMWKETKSLWIETCETVLEKRTRQYKEWITPDTRRKIEERRTKKAVLNNSKTRSAKAEANKEVKKSIKKDKKTFVESMAEEAEHAAGQKNIRELYNITRKLAGGKQVGNHPVFDKTRKVLTNPLMQCNRWKEHFEELLNCPPPSNPPDLIPAPEPLPINTCRPSKEEISQAINQLKNRKAPGPDGIPPEALKADQQTAVDALYDLFGKIWDTEEAPLDWKHGYIIKIPKK
uniref:Endonuclease/exonuclease/phosphatase domain-containing protein n=1 Tax=Oryzias latipes TaxID=8090 RepID=A0A3P9IPR5_ORYLA